MRELAERDASRERGDRLARAVRRYLEGSASRLELWVALSSYRRFELAELAPGERRRERVAR